MKKIAPLLFFKFLVIACIGQVPADSLKGTYVGIYFYASPPGSTWITSVDTFYVTNIDSVNCLIQASDKMNSFGGSYFTDYYSCNGTAPTNYFMKFYSTDSVKWIDDDVPQPWPNQPVSKRFYGKRISGSITGTNKLKGNEVVDVKIYPNPGNGLFTLQTKEKVSLSITNCIGQNVPMLPVEYRDKNILTIDLSQQAKGLYNLHITNNQSTVVSKILIQ